MTDREERILDLFDERMPYTYRREADFLCATKEFLHMFEDLHIVREAAATRAGVADLIICYKGRFIATELKCETGVPSPQQLKFIETIKKAGGKAGICRTLEDVWRLMN